MSERRSAIFPPRRAVEYAMAVPGARPVRLFALLLPVWCVEVRATVREAQPYEVFDGFLTRAIAEAHIDNPAELATFFGIQRSLVDRALRFLHTIGHIQWVADRITLTDLGAQSARDGCRYVVKEDRQKLYFDAFTSGPLPTSHYAGVRYLPEPTLTGPGRTRFQQVISLEPFVPNALAALLARPDRRDFNIPDGLRDAEALAVRQEWLPAYLIQNASTPPYLAFTAAGEGRDRHVEAISTAIAPTLAAEPTQDSRTVWRQWLDAKGFRDVVPEILDNGVLRATLPATAFGTGGGFRLYQLGSFEDHQNLFLQLWCTDEALRRRAVLDRAGNRVRSYAIKTSEVLRTQLEQFARQLAVSPPTVEELGQYAYETQDDSVLAVLDELT